MLQRYAKQSAVLLGPDDLELLQKFLEAWCEENAVDLTDELPAVANGWTLGASDWADCTITGDAGSAQTLSCSPETIAAGGSLSVVVAARLTAGDCGLLDNPMAKATSSNAPDAGDSGDIDVLCASLNLVKEPDAGDTGSVLDAGDAATYTMSVTNAGNGAAREARLKTADERSDPSSKGFQRSEHS